ncbi:TonB-dependent receptor [Sabulibacter ruber]|uniref:TonB-dependent receptor n=1 Tax=Sabulibacter ruber TaxID=2811901 RepID=UPI001A979725|nr:TonB-dependent receptor [Sabulibacter ruber]
MRNGYFTVLFLCICTSLVWAQTSRGTLTGTVLTQDGKPAAYAVVVLKGTGYGYGTREDGHFTLEAPAGDYTLQVQGLGLGRLERAVEVKPGQTVELKEVILRGNGIQLNDVVVTGQYEPQSVRKSVHQVRTIGRERILQRGAVNVQEVLTNELGIRFSQDLALGGSNIELQGMSGQNVKVLLDGVPLIGRQGTSNEIDLNQLDVNAIERIEIVEGPMSVVYGADALAGVINIITRKFSEEQLSVQARLQEETAGEEYGSGQGIHNQSVRVSWQRQGWAINGGGTRNRFGGWQGQAAERDKEWHPKTQWLGNVSLGYKNRNLETWYRLDALQEAITDENPFQGNEALDKEYMSQRLLHQLQANWRATDRWSFTGALGYTTFSRTTQTTTVHKDTGKRTLALGPGLQDVTGFDGVTARGIAYYKASPQITVQAGTEVNLESGNGGRLQAGTQRLHDYAAFATAEYSPVPSISLRPGVRVVRNSGYQAPPVIPSLNTRFSLGENLDLRLAYGRGFRAPSLRELYFSFFDASHSLQGNPHLKAELSHSFNGSLAWQAVKKPTVRLTSALGGFYNTVRNRIANGLDATDPQVTTYVNIERYRTTGGSFNNTLQWRNLELTMGAAYIGRYNQLQEGQTELPLFTWSPEVNSNLVFRFPRLGASFCFFYKYTGTLPYYEVAVVGNRETIRLAETAGFHWADASVTKNITQYVTLSGGVKNLFNMTRIRNTALGAGTAHAAEGDRPIGYGRSFFVGLNVQWHKPSP